MKLKIHTVYLPLLLLLATSYLQTVYAQGGNLIQVTEQDVKHVKDFWIGFFATGVPQVGERTTYAASSGAIAFNHTWGPATQNYSGVTINGNSSLDYVFSDNTFTFSTASATSRSGISTEDITAVPRGRGHLDILFTLNEASRVFFEVSIVADNNGTGGSGGDPYGRGRLEKQTGYDPDEEEPIFEPVFPVQILFDSTVGDGSDQLDLSSSALLEPGNYCISATAAVQNLYHQRNTTVNSSAQSVSLALTARFGAANLGDANGDGVLDNLDIAPFALALFDLPLYLIQFPGVAPDVVLDMNNDGIFDNLDITDFATALGF